MTKTKKADKRKGKSRSETIDSSTQRPGSNHTLSRYIMSKYIASKHANLRYAEEGAGGDREPGATSTMKNFPKSFIPMPELLDD